MTRPVGLVTGSQPFAGLPTNPAELVLPFIDGMIVEGIAVVTRSTPVSFASLPTLLPALIREHRPVFVMAIGLALGTPVVKVEALALNLAHFAIPDNENARPLGGVAFADGPDARRASWHAETVAAAIVAAEVPARVSFHAGTHLCNLTLYTYLAALEAERNPAPCGFLHLPYLPEQITWLMRQRAGAPESASTASLELPSMALATDVAAVKAAIGALARQSIVVHPTLQSEDIST